MCSRATADITTTAILLTHDRDMSFLRRSLGSIFRQTSMPERVIVCENGTEEHYGDVLAMVAAEFPAAEVIHVSDQSPAVARNASLKGCDTDFVAFLDDDDEWYPDKLRSQMDSVTEDTDIVCSPYEQDYPNTDSVFRIESGSIFMRNWIGATSFPLVRRSAIEGAGGFDESFVANQEWDLWMRVFDGKNVSVCGTLAGFKHTTNGISSNKHLRFNGWRGILDKHMPHYRSCPDELIFASRLFMNEMYDRHYPKGFVSALRYRSLGKKMKKVRTYDSWICSMRFLRLFLR